MFAASVEPQQRPLLRPLPRQIDPLRQCFRRESNRLGSGKDPRDEFGRKESKRDQMGHIATGDALRLGDLQKRSDPTARELLEPVPSTNDHLVDFALPFTQEPCPRHDFRLGGSHGRPTSGKILGGSVEPATCDSVETSKGSLLLLISECSEQKVSADARWTWGTEVIEPPFFQFI